ncbi:hypothetical protein ACN28C_00980 [Plantactinospora sp. WMMC1484]|uniref:hypothetical protein n=1 Tax=Plantactinospora sp. WMMC1484 TaxID=3404122 RepID=UPI003BF47C0E
MRMRWIAGVVLAGGLALGACADSGSTPSDGPEGSPVTPSAQPDPTATGPTPGGSSGPGPTVPGNPTAVTPTRPPHGGAPPSGTTTLSGTVRAGVEPNCVLLENYLLVGGPREVLVPGARVTVTGEVRAGLMTTCQQGTPFMVRIATRD